MKVVMFSQTTCGPCRQLMPHLAAACKMVDLELEVWNVDDNWSLCQEYGVTYTPTVFIMNDANDAVVLLETTNPRENKPNAMAIADELRKWVF